MKNDYRLALAVAGLLVGIGASSGAVFAQNTPARSATLEKVAATLKKNQLVFTVGGSTTIITADRIVRHGKDYTLHGNFRMVIPQGNVYEGKDAEVSLWDGEHGDGSPSRMLEISTKKCLTVLESLQSGKDKSGAVSRSINKDGDPVKVSLHLHPVTFYSQANGGKPAQ